MSTTGKFSRRAFSGSVFCGAIAPAFAQDAPASPPAPRRAPQDAPPFGETIELSRSPIPFKAEPFPLAAVTVGAGPFGNLQAWNRGYMARLDADRLLYNFRQNAGLDVKGAKQFGGWEGGTELRGHFTGHYLTASAQLWASTGDKAAKAKADYMVDELAKAQQKLGGSYLSAFPTELFDRLDKISIDLETGRPKPGSPRMPWAPFYTIHKIFAGMIDMADLAGNKQALEVALRMAEWADQYAASRTETHVQEILHEEFGGMAESFYNLGALTKDDRWIKAGDRFTKKRFMNALALRRDELTGLHMNTHVPQVIGAARRYDLTGDARFHTAAEFFWQEVAHARSYVTAGSSNSETWQQPPHRLAQELRNLRTVNTQECCCSYNMLKLTKQLYSWTADARYFDYYERALFNHRLGTVMPEKGYSSYFLSLVPGAWKTFGTEDQSFWCCTGSGIEEYSKLGGAIYWRDEAGLFVNLFIASELNWKERGFRMRQETNFPETPSTTLVVTAAKAAPMAIRLRVPAWIAGIPVVKVNGRALDASAAPGGYLVINHTWKAGDRIEMPLPMRLTMEAMPDDPHMQAFLYGPLVLAGDLGAEGLEERRIVGTQGPEFTQPGTPQPPNQQPRPSALSPMPQLGIPTFKANGDPSSWIKPAGGPLAFRTSGQRADVAMVPLNSLFGKRYSVYWQVE